MDKTCPRCRATVSEEFFFCPACGRKLREKPLSTSVLRQIGIYTLSIFLPPLGLWPAWKYLKQKDKKSRIIGLVAAVLTTVSFIITLRLTLDYLNALNAQINSLNF